jgi:molecular chaperone GrpE
LTGAGIEAILADFRDWLAQLPEAPSAGAAPESAAAEVVDLATLVRHFTALRQEVNLQTRASRAQLEQNSQALEKLGQAVDKVGQRSVDPADAVRPLLKSLIDVRDALALAQKQIAKSREATLTPPPTVTLDLPAWAHWFRLEATVRRSIAPLEDWARAQADAERNRQLLESLVVGYTMSLQRLDRVLESHGLERIDCVGLPFDPETMEVVEVVKDESRTSSVVLEDVRPGYRFRGQLFRCAQVRVARP